MHHTFTSEQWLPYPVEPVFAFFANPENLPRLMPRWQKARIEEASFAPPPPRPEPVEAPSLRGIAAGVGTRMTISFLPFPFAPLRVPWDAEIVEFGWNDHFCDVQTRGPFAFWRHCHHLTAQSREGKLGTLLSDHVEYEMPFGTLGEIARRLVIERQFRSMFAYRHQRTAELLAMTQPQRSV